MIDPCFAMHYLESFYLCNHLVKKERVNCFTLIVFLLLSAFGTLCLFLTLPLVGLQCVIVVFPGHTYLLFDVHYLSFIPFTLLS